MDPKRPGPVDRAKMGAKLEQEVTEPVPETAGV